MKSPEIRVQSAVSESPNNLKIKEALEETLAKAALTNIDLYLTGGTAAAVYAGETRPLSLDLDFLVDADAKAKIKKAFGGDFRYFGEKKLFKSDKLVALASNGVDLDFIAEQNIVPDEATPDRKITLRLNKLAKDKSCESEFMGVRVKVLPPEMIVIAKLFAGRGIELNKYDLADSEAVIASGIIRPDLFKRTALTIGGADEKITSLVYTRLLLALGKLQQTNEVKALAAGLKTAKDDSWQIEDIANSVRKTIPE